MGVSGDIEGHPAVALPESPFVGRSAERDRLASVLGTARGSQGSAWLVQGPIGIGKTRLVRWLKESATTQGFEVLSGYGLKEVNTPFFLFQQVFRARAAPERRKDQPLGESLSPVVIIEEGRPDRAYSEAARLSAQHPVLLLTRDRPAQVRERVPGLAASARVLWLTRAEGPDVLSPSNLDALGEKLGEHLRAAPSSVVVLAAVGYLVTQNGFAPVLRLLQFLRDVAEESGGHVLLSINPDAHEKREVSLFESEGEVVATEGAAPEAEVAGESPTHAMLRYLDTVETESRDHPCLIALDDLQWADPDSLRAFQFLARNIRGLPVALVATLRTDEVRSEEERAEERLVEVLDAMDREGTLSRVPLSGLGSPEARDLVSGLLGGPVASGSSMEHLAELVKRSRGNPFVLREVIAQLATEGQVRRQNDQWVIRDPEGLEVLGVTESPFLPENVRRLVSRQLDSLSTQDRTLLEWASVLGSEFSLTPLAEVMGQAPGDLDPQLHMLARRYRLLERRERPGEETWTFAQPLLWEVVRSEIPEGEFRARALTFAEWWAVHRPDEVETIARLFHDAEEGRRGLPWVRRALDLAVQSRAVETIGRYHRWLQDLHARAGTPVEARVRAGLEIAGKVEGRIGDSIELIALLRSLLTLDPPPELRVEILAHIALPLAWLAPKEAIPLLAEVEGSSREPAHSPEPVRYLVPMARSVLALREGDYREQHQWAERALRAGADIPLWARVRMLYYTGTSLCRMGRPAEAGQRLADLEHLSIPASEPRFVAMMSGLRVFIAEATGDVAAQCRGNEVAVAQMGLVGNPASMAIGYQNWGEARLDLGDLDGARECLRQQRRLLERFDLPFAQLPLLLEGKLAMREGRWAEAITFLGPAIEEMIRQSNREGLAPTRLDLAETYVHQGDLERAQALLAEARSVHESETDARPVQFALIQALIFEAQGKVAESGKSLDEAMQLVASEPGRTWGGRCRNARALWEREHGDPGRAATLQQEARTLFDQAGIWPDAWIRRWPAPLSRSGA